MHFQESSSSATTVGLPIVGRMALVRRTLRTITHDARRARRRIATPSGGRSHYATGRVHVTNVVPERCIDHNNCRDECDDG